MATKDAEKGPVPADEPESPSGSHVMKWFGWMAVFGFVGILVTIGVQIPVSDWCERDSVRQNRTWMLDQADQLRRGKIDCLVSPDPAFVEELLADTACAARVRDLYVGGDLSDPRLGRLRELPNLKCIVFLFARHHDVFLERLDGMGTIEELTFNRTYLSSGDVQRIAHFPNLRSLAFSEYPRPAGDLKGLGGHRLLERLAIDKAVPDKELIPILKSLPALREVSIGTGEGNSLLSPDAFQTLLDQALPHCQCRVWVDSY